MQHRTVYAFSAGLLSLSIAAWLLVIHPRAEARPVDRMESTKAEALVEYQACVKDAQTSYLRRWSDACQKKSEADTMGCRIEALCMPGTHIRGTEECVPRQRAKDVELDRQKLKENCEKAFPFTSECELPTDGAALNNVLERSKTDCRSMFDMRMTGYRLGGLL